MNNALLHIVDVTYSYDQSDWKLDQIDVSINKGDFAGIVGANGSGKSTLLKIVAGILNPQSGRILVENESIKKIPKRKLAQKIGYLPQQVNSVFDYNVEEVVAMGRFCHSKGLGLITQQDRDVIDHCMIVTETKRFRNRTINELSGGERQRVLLASVLAQQPDIMLLDEPVTGLDLHHQVSFFRLLSQLANKGMAILAITHDLNLASQFCSKILVLNKGKKVIYDSVENAFDHIGKLETFSKYVSVFKHPANQKPAVLPFNSENNGTDKT